MRMLLAALFLGLLTTTACGGGDRSSDATDLRFTISGYGFQPLEIRLACSPPRATAKGPGAPEGGVAWSAADACQGLAAMPWLVGRAPIPPGGGRLPRCSGTNTEGSIAVDGMLRGERVNFLLGGCRDFRVLPLLELLGQVGHG